MSELPSTTKAELEQGIFSLMMSLLHLHVANGMSEQAACHATSAVLENYARTLRDYHEERTIHEH